MDKDGGVCALAGIRRMVPALANYHNVGCHLAAEFDENGCRVEKGCPMSITIQTEAPPLRNDSSGACASVSPVSSWNSVIRAFQDGATPEAIIQRYPTVTLPDAYGVIAYYLRHQEDVDQYRATREERAVEVRKQIGGQQGDLRPSWAIARPVVPLWHENN